jgi:sarcosine oxidase subunit beta
MMDTVPPTAEVVVIGAGVIGCSTAYHLARAGLTDVLLLEMEQPGSGSSSKSASMLSLQFGSDPLLARMARYAYDRYMAFEREVGSPVDFKPSGWLTVVDEGGANDLRQHASTLQSIDITTELLTPEEVAQLYPELAFPGLALGAYGPQDGPLDAHLVLWGYLQAARRLGVRLREETAATGLLVESGRVEGVETAAGVVRTRCVVNAAGPWAARVADWAGIELPLSNRNRTIVVTDPVEAIRHDRPFLEIPALGWYARPELEGMLMGMGTTPTGSLTPTLDREMVEQIIGIGMQVLPPLQDARLQTAWTGVRPLTVDERPVLGPVPGIEGLMLNTGWGGMGIIQAPVAGELLAELIVNGGTTNFNVETFLIERFSR